MKVTRTKIDSSKVVVKNPLIQGGGGIEPEGTLQINSNGTYDVINYAEVKVSTPVPSGSLTITENGSHNVKTYSSVYVNVPIPDGYIQEKTLDDIPFNEELKGTKWLILNDTSNWGSSFGDSLVLAGYDSNITNWGYYYDANLTKTEITTSFTTTNDMGEEVSVMNASNVFKSGNIVVFHEAPSYDYNYDPGYNCYMHNNNCDLVSWLVTNAVLLV